MPGGLLKINWEKQYMLVHLKATTGGPLKCFDTVTTTILLILQYQRLLIN